VLRYFILFFAVIVALQSLLGLMGKKEFKPANKSFALFLLICCDLQLVMGLLLYHSFVIASGMLHGNVMKDPIARFWAVEHAFAMIVAIVLVHIGYARAKKPAVNSERKFKRLFWCSFAALCIFVAMTPWEGKSGVGRPNIPVMPHSAPAADTAHAH
jgi:hypothetical protein